MDIGEFEPQEIRESGEGSEDAEGQELNDATFEPLAYIEQSGGYQQAEAIQGDLTALTDASSTPPIPLEVEAILMGEGPPPTDGGEKGGIPFRYTAGTSVPPPPEEAPGSGMDYGHEEAPGTGMDYGYEKAPGSGADDMPPERAMGSGADDMPPEKAPGSGADDAPYEKAAGTGVDRPEPIDEPGAKEEQGMKYERDSDLSSRRKRD